MRNAARRTIRRHTRIRVPQCTHDVCPAPAAISGLLECPTAHWTQLAAHSSAAARERAGATLWAHCPAGRPDVSLRDALTTQRVLVCSAGPAEPLALRNDRRSVTCLSTNDQPRMGACIRGQSRWWECMCSRACARMRAHTYIHTYIHAQLMQLHMLRTECPLCAYAEVGGLV